jgi:hypothetical protein
MPSPLRAFAALAWKHKTWWLIPLVLAGLLLGLLISLSDDNTPFLYTFF